ncbi:polysaccharide pyruvyl transferase family protein [Sphingobium sp. H39-3-25]|uniref:polysaccharide pyruvyl transferase family protein n=1 Tax=Sphingobium arseniciresistens TaxID=3030834 RepID=UPI0023B9A7B0|nr:polysaccharide pyruvyl transferase family protein [Sphingobium arseniciresistens]
MKNIQIGLLWHTIGQGNLGVDALARANAAIVRNAAEKAGRSVSFVTMGFGEPKSIGDLPQDIRVGPGPRIKEILRGKSDFYPTLRACDLVIDIGEGDSWTDIYGNWRFMLQAGSKLATLAAGKPLILAPQTMGPFNNPVRKAIASGIMNRAAAVFARDNLSMDYLKSAKIKAPMDEFIDVAFRLPFTRQPKLAGKDRIGFNVSGLLYKGGYSGSNELGLTIDYQRYCHAVIEKLLGKNDAEVHLISHVVSANGGNDDDLPVMDELLKRYPALIAAPAFSSASEAKSYMSGLDAVIAARMHACIGAFSAGVPVVPIAYSRKFNGLFGTLGYPYFIDGKSASTEEAIDNTLLWLENRDDLHAKLEPALAFAEERLASYEKRLTMIIRGL